MFGAMDGDGGGVELELTGDGGVGVTGNHAALYSTSAVQVAAD